MPSRVIIDVSTLTRWSGPPVGIVRVECELARWAAANATDVIFAFFDPGTKTYRPFKDNWVKRLIDRTFSASPWILPNTRQRRRRSDRIPQALRPAINWLVHSRRNLLLQLENVRLNSKSERVRSAAEKLQRPLLTKKYRPIMFHPDGSRKAIVPLNQFLGPAINFTAQDTLICAGMPWAHSDIDSIVELKARHGLRFVTLCHDIIPILFPQYYKQVDADAFKAFYEVAFAAADLVVFTAQSSRRDAIAYCTSHNLKIGDSCVVPLGADIADPHAAVNAALPDGIARDRYALLVSTIEPRKGHKLIYDIWLSLLAEGIPQKTGFKLVFVGRPGWQVDELIAKLKTDPRLHGSLHLLTSVDDAQLSSLYKGAAFCLYPSVYEGYGLPVIEAFLRGKAVLASTGGAIPEVVGGLSPCLDPHDEKLWYSMLAQWISDPAARAPHEAAIRARFHPRSWSTAAHQFFEMAGRNQVS
ncbi:MAG: glycosyltransferase family 1 protein [Pseudolabrys sp.]